jgi:hypothetical protein
MLATFQQQLAARYLKRGLQTIQLLVQTLGSRPHPWFHQLGQPLATMTVGVDARARTGNGPTDFASLRTYQT